MKKQKLIILRRILFLSLCLSLLIFMLMLQGIKKIEQGQISPYSILICNEDDIFLDAHCINEYVKSFYKYNISNSGKDLSFEELKEVGGVCSHWSEYFCSVGNSLGYYTSTPDFKTRIEGDYLIYHQVCIWSNSQGYIILDGPNLYEGKFS